MHTKKDKKEKVCIQNSNQTNLKHGDNATLEDLHKKMKKVPKPTQIKKELL